MIPKHAVKHEPSVLSGLPPILLGVLSGMDVPGEMILGTWLYGGGADHDVEEPLWNDYMMAHDGLRRQILAHLKPAVARIAASKKVGRFPLAERFHVEFPENNGFSGYALLHGSNKDVGDFLLTGFAEVREAVDPAPGNLDIELELRFVFNDFVDPNGNYIMDRIRAGVAKFVLDGQPRNYRLSIHWSSSCLAEVRQGKGTAFSGYPSEVARGIRPLPRGTLDVAASHRRSAQEIEGKILTQLRRNIRPADTASLADRKQRLLWLFHRLSGYWGSTYLERISRHAASDELTRLLQQRISRELRSEIVETLRGRRPPGVEPK